MSNFKPGDKVIMKEEVTDQTIVEMSIAPSIHPQIKGKKVTVKSFSRGARTITFEEFPYIWDSKWFRHYSNIPEEFFEIE